MLVLRGATSQWKRSRSGMRPIGPAAAPPSHTAAIAVERAAEGAQVEVGVEREEPGLVDVEAGAQVAALVGRRRSRRR